MLRLRFVVLFVVKLLVVVGVFVFVWLISFVVGFGACCLDCPFVT